MVQIRVLPRRSRRSHRQQSSWQRTWPRKLRTESSEAPELPGGKSGEAIGAAAARTWNGYDISEIPESFLPPPEAKGKHSYTLRLDDEQICLDILIRNRAIWVKKPEGCKGQYSFRQYDSISSCFAECLKDCRKFLKDQTTALLLE